MTPERWQKVKELLAQAEALPVPERAAFVERLRAADEEIGNEVASLLSAGQRAGDFLERPAALPGPTEGPPDPPRRIGPYEVEREVGRGGMGTVYLARRPDLPGRKVAVKVLQHGFDAKVLLTRFRAERRILAALEHPYVARLFDAGTGDDGRPYFALEYVEGEPLSTWCDARRLGVAERLELFRKVCEAVAFAHARLVVHRDIKPGNVLVAADGTPKLLDFGIAKVLGDALGADETALLTRTEERALTPQYASPEQVSGALVTTASDVYSLGVVLFELLTGRRPYRLTTRRVEEVLRAVREQEAGRPSDAVLEPLEVRGRDGAVLATQPPEEVAAARATTPARLSRSLQGDLDTIVATALRKEPERRYASAAELAEDVRRHLVGLPVRARPDELAYRAGKFVRRHRVAVLAASAAALSLVLGLAAALWQARQARTERERAEGARAEAEALVDFMIGDLRKKLEPAQRLSILDDVGRRALAYFDRLPEADRTGATRLRHASALQQLAGTALLRGDLAAAEEMALGSLSLLPPGDPTPAVERRRAAGRSLLGRLAEEKGDASAALAAHEEASRLFAALALSAPSDVELALEAADSANDVGRVLYFQGRLAEAAERHEAARALVQGPSARDPSARRALAKTLSYLGRVREEEGKLPDAVASFREAAALADAVAASSPEDRDNEHDRAVFRNDLGRALRKLGRLDEALVPFEEARAISRGLSGKDPDSVLYREDVAAGHYFVGRVQEMSGRLDAALLEYRADVAISEELLAKESGSPARAATLADSLTNVGRVERRRGRPDAAIPVHRRALALRRQLLAAAPDNAAGAAGVGESLLEIARAEGLRGRTDEAREALEEAIPLLARAAPSGLGRHRSLHAQALLAAGREAEAREAAGPLLTGASPDPELAALFAAAAGGAR